MTVTFSQLGTYGRFGNQLFQIASTIGIAIKNNHDYFFPEWQYQQYFKNKLPTANIIPEYVVQELTPYYQDINLKPNHYYNLIGYFQSYKYFEHCENLIRHFFLFNEYEDVMSDSIALHVRRGDYLNLDNHPVLSIEYYKEALSRLPDDLAVWIYSDDVQWCMDNMYDIVPSTRPLLFSYNNDEISDFIAMKHSKYNVIANSSFSWWAAYLNLNEDKVIIAPSIYVANEDRTDDRYPKDWIVI